MNDMTFRGRIKVSALKYADSLLVAAVAVSTHSALVRWAGRCFQQPDQVAMELQPPVVMDAAVQSAGAAITDAALQGAVETVVGKVA